MVKALKRLLQNQESFEAESWYIAWGLKVYEVCLNDGRGMTFDLLWQGQICALIHLYEENVEKSLSQNVLKTNG